MEKTKRIHSAIYSFGAKAAAVTVSVVLVPIIIFFSSMLVVFYSMGLSGDAGFYESDIAKRLALQYAWEVYDAHTYAASDIQMIYPENDAGSNFRFALYEGDELIYDNHSDSDIYIDSNLYISEYYKPDLNIEVYFTSALTVKDSIFWAEQLFDAARLTYEPALIAAPLSIVLELALLVYLACAAGRKKGEIAPGWQEKIPFDLYLAADIILGCCLIALAMEAAYASRWFEPFYTVSALGCCTLVWVLFIGLWLTFCARAKLGIVVKNTLIGTVIRLLLRAARVVGGWICAVYREIPFIWRAMLIALAVLVLTALVPILFIPVFFAAACFALLQLRLLLQAGSAMAAGDFSQKVDVSHMFGDIKRHGENLNSIGNGMNLAVEQRMRSERLKTELITNVSHDIKTPLTSIINYVDLLRREHTPEQEAEYIDVLSRQSARLKKLTEDVVELSKASTGNISCELSRRNASELIEQSLAEYADRFADAGIEPIVSVPEKPVFCLADGRLMWRVIDNLLSNVCKYALPGTRLYVNLSSEKAAVFSFKNISRERLNISADELMERFVRGDLSRGTEGSGLGLNIASSLMSVQGGSLSLTIDGDLFKAELSLPLAEAGEIAAPAAN